MRTIALLAAGAALLTGTAALAEEIRVEIHRIDQQGLGEILGTVTLKDSAAGLMLSPDLKGLPAGPHGFHVHEFPDCGSAEKDGNKVAGLAAGNHYDPHNTGRHAGPLGAGHLGDLPVLEVAPDGSAARPVTATRLRVADVRGRSLMIHAENDNYADKPGGARIACGVVR